MTNGAPAGDRVPLGNQSHTGSGFGNFEKPSKDACTWAMLCHIFGLGWCIIPGIGGVIGSLIVWQIKKDQYPFVDVHGKEALNFQISMLIYGAISFLLIFVICGAFLLPLVIIADIVFTIIAAIKAGQGESYRYPLSIRFVS
jgi:hypothetical protein